MAFYQKNKCSVDDMNIVFLIDSSSSMSRFDFLNVRQFLSQAIAKDLRTSDLITRQNINVAMRGFSKGKSISTSA